MNKWKKAYRTSTGFVTRRTDAPCLLDHGEWWNQRPVMEVHTQESDFFSETWGTSVEITFNRNSWRYWVCWGAGSTGLLWATKDYMWQKMRSERWHTNQQLGSPKSGNRILTKDPQSVTGGGVIRTRADCIPCCGRRSTPGCNNTSKYTRIHQLMWNTT